MTDQTWTPAADLDRVFEVDTGDTGGGVSDHGELDGLDDDDHDLYALADGSRGSFATTAQGAKADTAVQPADLAAYATDAEMASAISAAVDALLDGAPGALDTLNELAAAVNDDASFAASVTAALAGKVPTTRTLAGLDLSQDRSAPAIKTALSLVKGDVGLGSVDNTADTAKPVSTAQQTALDLKAPLASPAFTGTPTGITKTHVGLGNVDNTADASKSFGASQITSGTIATARLGSGTANSSTFLRGDQTYAAAGDGYVVISDQTLVSSASAISITGLSGYRDFDLVVVTRSSSTGAIRADLRLRFSADNGSTYDAGTSYQNGQFGSENTRVIAGLVAASQTNSTRAGWTRNQWGTSAVGWMHGSMLYSFTDSTGTQPPSSPPSGWYWSGTPCTGLQLTLSTGDFVTGTRVLLRGRA